MLMVTDAAVARLAGILAEAEAPDDIAVRLVLEGRGVSLQFDSPRPDDATFPHEGRTVLMIDEQVSKLLRDRTLDMEDTDDGPQLSVL